jgi:hypothetical protein
MSHYPNLGMANLGSEKLESLMDKDEKLQTEYEQCFDNWRFVVGLRFTILAFFLTLTSGLVYIAFTMHEAFHPRTLQVIVYVIGILASGLVWIMEKRNKELYDVCIQRAEQVEEQWYSHAERPAPLLTATNGLAHQIESKKASPLSSHSNGILGFYRISAFIWLLLLLAAIFGKFPVIIQKTSN